MLKKPVKSVRTVKKTPTKLSPLQQAYDLVSKDLFTTLKKAKDGTTIQLGDCGLLRKKLARIRNPYGEVYRYYRLSFQTSRLLKKELDK